MLWISVWWCGGLGLLFIVEASEPRGKVQALRIPAPPDSYRIEFLYEFRSPKDLQIQEKWWRQWSGKRDVPQLQQPMSVCVGKKGIIYVADGSNGVFAFLPKKWVRWKTFAEWSPHLTAITRDSDERLYVLDSRSNRVMVLNSQLKVLSVWDTGLERASGLTLDPQRQELYLGDVKRHAIVVFSTSGKRLREWGGGGDSTAGLHSPTHLLFRDEWLYVTDALNFRVKKFDRDGTLLASVGGVGNVSGRFSRPKGVALDSDHHWYVVDALFGNVQIFDEKGNLLLYFGKNGTGLGEFNLPNGIWIDEQDRIYIADTYNGRIQVYQYHSVARAHP